jgi:hypothetical protein
MTAQLPSSAGQEEGGKAPVTPLAVVPPESRTKTASNRRKPNRGKDGGRTINKAVWLTTGEDTRLTALAQDAGLSVGSYLRACALGDPGQRARRVPSIDHEVVIRLIAEMNRIGSNINQLARNSNRGKEVDEDILTDTLREHQRILTAAWEAMRG